MSDHSSLFCCPAKASTSASVGMAGIAPLREQVRADASLIRRLDIWNMSEEEMAVHPYVGRAAARSIVRYRRVSDSAARNLAGLLRENAIDSARYEKLRYYVVR